MRLLPTPPLMPTRGAVRGYSLFTRRTLDASRAPAHSCTAQLKEQALARSNRTAVAFDPALERDRIDLYNALTDLVRLYQFRDRNMICSNGVSVTQCYALQTLSRGGPMTLGALAKSLRLDKSTVSRVVETLKRKGHLRRSIDPGDARAVRLEVTAKGRALHARIEKEILAEERDILVGLQPDVRRAVIGVLRGLTSVAAARFGSGAMCGVPPSGARSSGAPPSGASPPRE